MKEQHLTLKQLPVSEQPYEKCIKYGPEFLSDAELLAVVIKSGTKNLRAVDVAMNVLNYSSSHKGLIGLNHMSINELKSIDGIGQVKAIQILCVAELTKRMAKVTNEKGIFFNNSGKVAQYYMQDMRHLENEQVLLLLLNTKNKLIKEVKLSSGTVNVSLVNPREVFIYALKNDAVNIILLHNHPSGDPTPSKEDVMITKRIKESGALIGINLIDHIIIGDNIYSSFGENGLLND